MKEKKKNSALELITVLAFFCVVLFYSCSSSEQGSESTNATSKKNSALEAGEPLNMNPIGRPDGKGQQRAIALLRPLGIKYDSLYAYGDFAKLKGRHGIGDAGDFEEMKCSVVSEGTDLASLWKAQEKARDLESRWEQVYYKGINQTWIVEIIKQRPKAWVRVIKVAKGRDPDLNIH